MISAIKDWLPITVRNRVALGFAFAALVMFLTWNFLPNYEVRYVLSSYNNYARDGFIFMEAWPNIVDPYLIVSVIKSPDVDGFISLAASIALLMNGLIVLGLVPFWKILHASSYLKIPVAFVNIIGGGVMIKYFFESLKEEMPPYISMALLLIALSMFAVFLAMLIFKNELSLRHELEVKRMMGGGDSQ